MNIFVGGPAGGGGGDHVAGDGAPVGCDPRVGGGGGGELATIPKGFQPSLTCASAC